jgi:hypothetical protein
MEGTIEKRKGWKGPEDKRHIITPEDRSKAGKVRSPAKDRVLKFAAIRYCSEVCPMWPCIYQPLCQLVEKNGKRACAVKALDKPTQQLFLKFLDPSEENFKQVLAELLTELHSQVKAKPSVHGTSMLLDYTMKVNDTLWGRKVRQDVKGDLSGVVEVKWKQ